MKLKKILSATLATTLCLSMAACGNDSTQVEDYASSSPSATISDAQYITTAAASGTLQEIFGKKVEYNNEFKIGESNFSGNLQYEIPDQDGLNVYNTISTDNGRKDEDAIVKAFFGGTAKKIESISYTNEYDYITLLYKYYEIDNMHKKGLDFLDAQTSVSWEKESIVINSSFPETFKWTDSEDYYIHMYEGDYNNCPYVLLLAYDILFDKRYIFFEPKSIKDYFPDYDFKTLIVAGNINQNGSPIEIENNCTDDIETLKSDAQNVLDNFLMLNGKFSITENSYLYNLNNWDNAVIFANIDSFGRNTSNNPSDYDDISWSLMFSNTDYLSTITTGVTGFPICHYNISGQKDLLVDYNATQETPIDIPTFYYMEAGSEMIEEATFTTDGYALYIDGLKEHEEDPNAITLHEYNNGIIKYTSIGLYSIDIEISDNFTDVIENVKLQDFNHIKNSFDSQIKDMLDLSELNYPTNIVLNRIELNYSSYVPDENTDYEAYIPIWSFELVNSTESNLIAYVSINAMDGSIIGIEYYDYNDYLQDN